MNAIILPDYNANIIRAMKGLAVGEVPVPEPGTGQVLIKVNSAPCNPSDIAFMRGGYGIRKPVPVVMGFECTGTVVKTGGDPESQSLMGKRVSCFSQGQENGTWAQYFLGNSSDCIVIREDIPDDQAAAFCINPFTAYALVSLAKASGTPAIIQNGSSGQVGVFVRVLAAREGIRVINLVRKEEQVKALQEEGEDHVLWMSDPAFEGRLADLAKHTGAAMAFDAVGGEISGMILNAMPAGSELVIYGGLSGKPAGSFNTLGIIFERKTISGFNLGDWKKDIGPEAFHSISGELQDLVVRRIIQTKIQGTFSLEEVQQAMEQYIRNMSAGKILFRP
jgi:NADPH:quinone reductase-like Zn-dependent oxidoreductase